MKDVVAGPWLGRHWRDVLAAVTVTVALGLLLSGGGSPLRRLERQRGHAGAAHAYVGLASVEVDPGR